MNKIHLILTFSLIVSALSSCATNNESSNAESKAGNTTNAAIVNSENEVICKKVQVKGSNIKKKVCKTRAEMAIERERAGEVMEKIRSTTNRNSN